ncbi:cation:proton antiporter [Rhizobium halophytocola]|uniref:CPA1 family monovalent cation:H+ antiporter n=1 Tax=Rhizobium halophytocola TaxID=735519 RepID=A0ABS4E6N8_9HYPH|nr:sodium:proton antiporter [Rhizobium halophytocola]MBP1853577.1 CPA1 family monovalent cation:H+ antiporter [Rhizobium halophytocola]
MEFAAPAPFDVIAIVLTMTAVFSWINERFLKLPNTVGILLMALLVSIGLLGVNALFPAISLDQSLETVVRAVDFQETLLTGMLAFLLFAGALHVDFSTLHSRKVVVAVMATFGVLISSGLIATAVWFVSAAIGTPIPFMWALVFGALISPTDPVAVLAALKAVAMPASLRADLSGESLFNDGVGVVLFSVTLAMASGGEQGLAALGDASSMLVVEALGGGLLGLAAGFLSFKAMEKVDNYSVEVIVSLATVTATYAFADHIHVSGPIAVVAAGLFLGNRGPQRAMSDLTQRYLFGFWTLIDEILNAVLFLLIGLEVLILRSEAQLLTLLPLAAIPIVLLARFIAVGLPILAMRPWQTFVRGTVATLTWGGLRGGISVALALSLPEIPEKATILAATYVVVLFTIIVQGLTLTRVVRRVVTPE